MITKFISNIILIPINGIFEKGAVIGNILSNIITFIISYKTLRSTIKFEFEIFMKDKKSLTRIELIEELINLWEDRVNTDQNEIAEVYLACIYRLKNISDIEFENIKNTNLLFQFDNI